VKELATQTETVHGSNNSECYHPYELTPTQGQNGIEHEHTNTRNIGKGPATQGHSSPHDTAKLRRMENRPPHNYGTTHLSSMPPHIALLL